MQIWKLWPIPVQAARKLGKHRRLSHIHGKCHPGFGHEFMWSFAGPVQGHMFLVIVDAFSKWPEVIKMKSTTAECTINALRTVFARFGVPEQLVSDNGPQFVSDEFEEFTKRNGIRHLRGAPYHPATNGLAERFVQSFKTALKAAKTSQLQKQLDIFLLAYRNVEHSTTGQSPAMVMFGRPLRTRLDLVRPDLRKQTEHSLVDRVKHQKVRSFEIGQHVLARNYRYGPKWRKGEILEQIGPLVYKVSVDDMIWKRHVNQLLLVNVCDQNENDKVTSDVSVSDNYMDLPVDNTPAVVNIAPPSIVAETLPRSSAVLPESVAAAEKPPETNVTVPIADAVQVQKTATPQRQSSSRVVRPPKRLITEM